MAPERRVAGDERHAVSIRYAGDPTGTGSRSAARAAARRPTPGARNTARGDPSSTRTSRWLDTSRGGKDRIEFRADMFNAFNQWNVTADGYVNCRHRDFGQHTGGSRVWPGRQFQFATTYRF